jgi:hypothetical protein
MPSRPHPRPHPSRRQGRRPAAARARANTDTWWGTKKRKKLENIQEPNEHQVQKGSLSISNHGSNCNSVNPSPHTLEDACIREPHSSGNKTQTVFTNQNPLQYTMNDVSETSVDLIDAGILTIDDDSSFERHHHNDEKVNVDGKFVVSWKYN